MDDDLAQRGWLNARWRVLGSSAGAMIVVRLLGLGSQVLAASTFGASADLDAFFIALIVPTLVSVPVVGSGELAFSPLAARVSPKSTSAAELCRRVLLLFGGLGTAAALILVVAIPVLVWISAPGADDQVRDIATRLAYVLYPTVAATVVAGGASALLIGAGRIRAPILFQLFRPVLMVAVLLWSPHPTVFQLAAAVLIGSALEASASILAACRLLGIRGDHVDDKEAFASARAALRPLVGTALIIQLAPIADQSFVASSGAGRLVTFVLAVRVYDIGKTFLIQPVTRLAQVAVARAAAGPDLEETIRVEARRCAFAGGLSALVVGLAAPLIITLVFVRGDFTDKDAMATINVLAVLAVALLPFALSAFLQRVLVAIGRVRLLTVVVLAYSGTSILLDAFLVQVAGAVGVALATLIALVVTVVVLAVVLKKDLAARTLPGPPELEDQ